jgi:hypothetical protein
LWTKQIYKTQYSWLTLHVRNYSSLDFDPVWTEYSDGNMTWEAWFRITELPATGSAMLMGTYGSEHDQFHWFNDTITYSRIPANLEDSASRRRYAAVWVDSAGRVSMNTIVGMSTGAMYGPTNISFADGKWHHVAASWLTTGGKKVTVRMSADKVNWNNVVLVALYPTWSKLREFEEAIRAAVVALLPPRFGIDSRGVFVHAEGDFSDFTILYRTTIVVTVNCPAEHFTAVRDFMAGRVRLSTAIVAALETIEGIKPGGYIGGISIPIELMNFPVETDVGSAMLHVDGVAGTGSIVYDRQMELGENLFATDTIATDGVFQTAGGKLGEPLACEVSRFRLWNRVLTQSQLYEVQQCDLPPELPRVMGGPRPFGLVASWNLDGDYYDRAEVQTLPQIEDTNYGRFIRDEGLCGYSKCPDVSEEGCPLQRSLLFPSGDKCEEFAAFNLCRTSGFARGRPPHPFRDGCHVGGKSPGWIFPGGLYPQ